MGQCNSSTDNSNARKYGLGETKYTKMLKFSQKLQIRDSVLDKMYNIFKKVDADCSGTISRLGKF